MGPGAPGSGGMGPAHRNRAVVLVQLDGRGGAAVVVDVSVAGAEQRDAEAVGDRLEGLLAVGDSAADPRRPGRRGSRGRGRESLSGPACPGPVMRARAGSSPSRHGTRA